MVKGEESHPEGEIHLLKQTPKVGHANHLLDMSRSLLGCKDLSGF